MGAPAATSSGRKAWGTAAKRGKPVEMGPMEMRPMDMETRPSPARARILDAALRLFAAHGFDGVSTVRIAETADISQSVVLYHFGSKQKLWRESMLHLFAQIGMAGGAAPSDIKDLDPLSRLRVALRRFVRISARHPELGRIIMREGAEGGERLDWLARNALTANYDVFTGLVSAAQEAGLVKPHPPFQLTILLHAACSVLFHLQPLVAAVEGDSSAGSNATGDNATGDNLEEVSDMIIDTLFNGICVRAGAGQ